VPVLHAALVREISNMGMVKLLIKLGVNINARYRGEDVRFGLTSGDTALHVLAFSTHWWQPIAMDYLLEAGASIELQNSKGQTALHIAICGGADHSPHGGFWRQRSTAALLKRGAMVNALTSKGETPLHLASRTGIHSIRSLLDHGADPSLGEPPPIFSAITGLDVEVVKAFLEAGVDCDAYGLSKEEARFSISRMANVFRRETPLQLAACNYGVYTEKGRAATVSIMTLLLQHGADASKILQDGTPVLSDIAERNGLLGPILSFGVDIEIRDSHGRTPFLVACEHPDSPWPS